MIHQTLIIFVVFHRWMMMMWVHIVGYREISDPSCTRGVIRCSRKVVKWNLNLAGTGQSTAAQSVLHVPQRVPMISRDERERRTRIIRLGYGTSAQNVAAPSITS